MNKFLYTLTILSALGLSACVENQPRYYQQPQTPPYQPGELTPFSEAEIAQAKRDEETLAAALADTSSRVDTARWQSEVRRICVTDLGFPFGSPAYTTCHDFYYQQAAQYGINVNTITAAQINALLLWSNPIIHGCRGYGYVGDVLWGCVYRGEHRHYDHWYRHHPHHPKPHHGGAAPHGGHHHVNPTPHGGHGGHSPTPHGGPKAPAGGHGVPHGGHGGPAPHGGHGGGPKH